MAGGHARRSRASATSKKPVYASHSDDSSDEDFAEASNKKKGKNSKATGKRKDPPPRITLSPATKAPPQNEQKYKDEEQGDNELKMSADALGMMGSSRKKHTPSTSTTTKSKNKMKGNPLYVYYDLEATGIETNDVFLEEVKIFQIGARSSRHSSKAFSGRSSMFACAMCNNIIIVHYSYILSSFLLHRIC